MRTGTDRANLALERLRASWTTRNVEDGTPLVERVWFDIDREEGDLILQYDTTGPGLMRVTTSATSPGRWLTLNVNLESGSLAGARLIGFAAKMQDQHSQTIRACVRSFRDGTFQDVFFPTYLYASGEDTSHSDILWIAEQEALMQPAEWRTFLLFFEPGEFTLSISELNVFVV